MAGVLGPTKNYITELRSRGWATFAPKYTIGNFDQALNIAWYEDPWGGERRVFKGHRENQKKKIMEAIENKLIPENVVQSSRARGSMNLIAKWIKANTELDIMTDEDITERTREDLKIVKKSYEEMQREGGFLDTLKGIGGAAIPEILSPMLLPAWFVGYGPASLGVKSLVNLGKAVGTEFLLETAYQTAKYQWKDEISEASMAEAITSIVAVTGLVGGIGITAIGLSRGMKEFLNKYASSDIEDVGKSYSFHKAKQMADEMEQVNAVMDIGKISAKELITGRQAVLLHVASRQLGLSPENYAAILKEYGVKSTSDLTQQQFTEVLELFKEGGFTVKPKTALDWGKELQAEDKYQNTVHLKEQEVRNDTQFPDKLDDETLDASYQKIVDEKPDLELAERMEGDEVVTSKVKDIVKRLTTRLKILDKIKECF